MNIFDIIDFTRSEILDDTIKPYGWENKALLGHLNRAYEELCRESKCIIDSTTAATCRINLLSNQGVFPLHSRVIYVYGARRQSDGAKIWPKTEEYMDRLFANWQSIVGKPYLRIMNTQNRFLTIYPKFDSIGYVAGISDIDFAVASGPVYTIEKSGATFLSHFSIGDSLVVTGTDSSNGTFTIADLTDTVITVNEMIVAATDTSAILQKIRDVALLRVARLPLIPWKLAELEGETPPSPEIDETYHLGLSDGIGKFVFRKQDTETYDPEKAKFHEEEFEQFKSDVRWDMTQLMEGDTICNPHFGMI